MTHRTETPKSGSTTVSRLNHAVGPVAAGMIIDAVDVVTLGPVGVIVGPPVGAAAGYWLGRSMKLGPWQCALCGLAAAIYCTLPFTEILPLGTLVGALLRYSQDATSQDHAGET